MYSCREQGQHQGNRHQIFKIMWIWNVPAWDGNFYFGSILEVTQRLSVSPLMIHICSLSWHFSYSLVSPGELVGFARYNRSDLKTYVGKGRVCLLSSRSKEVERGETLTSFTGNLFFSKARRILQDMYSEYYDKCSNYLPPTYCLFYLFPFCKYS